MDKVNVSYRVDERLTIRGGYNREKKKKIYVEPLHPWNAASESLPQFAEKVLAEITKFVLLPTPEQALIILLQRVSISCLWRIKLDALQMDTSIISLDIIYSLDDQD